MRFLLTAVDSLPGALILATETGVIVAVNREFEQQFSYSREELIGQSVDAVIPEALLSTCLANRERSVRTPELRRIGQGRELLGRRQDGSLIPVEIGVNVVPTDEGRFVLVSVSDGSARREAAMFHRLGVEEQLGFERLLTDLSGHFIDVPADRIDESIRTALGRVSEVFGADRSTLQRFARDGIAADEVMWTAGDWPAPDFTGPASAGFPWTVSRILAGEIVWLADVKAVSSDVDRRNYQALGIASMLAVPLTVGGEVAGAVAFDRVSVDGAWSSETLHRLTIAAGVFAQVLARQQRDEAVRAALAEVRRLKEELQAENRSLRESRSWHVSPQAMGQSPALARVLDQIRQVAATDSTVLLLGETGTGKEFFAAQIHELGARRHRPMVRVNCAAIPATLIESELFGRERGAYTGALSRQVGRFELADQSTIFLDEIGDLPPDVQVKLLRVLEERQIERLGSPRPINVDTRIIAATHHDLEQRLASGAFRADLFYRLNVFPIHVPPLRERVEEIPQLVWRFVTEFSKAFGKRIDTIAKESLVGLQQYSWPGNVRELRNVVERAMIVAAGPRLLIPLPPSSNAAGRRSPRLIDVEKEHIRSVLEGTHWRIRGAGGAADRLGLKPTTLETRMARLGLRRPAPG
jgi:PAS domain S-box-containing protein